MSDSQLAAQIAELVGGPANVTQVNTCATRLRFNLKDRSKVQKEELTATKGVLQVVESAGQTQVVIGPNVGDVYRALLQLPKWDALSNDGSSPSSERGGFLSWLFGLLSGTFQPLLMPLLGASMLKMILGLAAQFNLYDTANPGPLVLVFTAASNAFFYFLPILIGATASQKLGATPFLGAAIAASLLDPSFVAIGKTGEVVQFIFVPMYVFSYASSVFPAILIAIALSFLEPFLRRIIHKNVQLLLVPLICMAILVPLSALVFGPIGVWAGQALTDAITFLNGVSSILMGALVGGSFLLMVMFGLHWALVPVILLNIQNGGDPIIPAGGAYNFAVWGLAVAVFIKSKKDLELRELAGAGAASGLLAGISEPMLYGVILRFKRVIPIVVGSAVVGGAIVGAFKVTTQAFGFTSLFTIPLMTPTVGYVIAIAVSFTLTLVGVLIFGYESKAEIAARAAAGAGGASSSQSDAVGDALAATASATAARAGGTLVANRVSAETITITSPLGGTLLPLVDVPDPVFSAGVVGPGVGILPSRGEAIAPFAGTVIVAPPSGHAVGLRSVDGVEILIHIGIDTVNLEGRGFDPKVRVGQHVKVGDTLVTFDIDTIKDAGYSVVTPVLITNAATLGNVTPTDAAEVDVRTPLLHIESRQSS